MTIKGTSNSLAQRGPSDNARCGAPSSNGGGRFLASPPRRRSLGEAAWRRIDPRVARQNGRETAAMRES